MKTLVAAPAASMCPAAPAFAQDRYQGGVGDDAVVVTGTKTGNFGVKSGIPIDKVPQSIQAIDADHSISSGAQRQSVCHGFLACKHVGQARQHPGEPRSLGVRVAYQSGARNDER